MATPKNTNKQGKGKAAAAAETKAVEAAKAAKAAKAVEAAKAKAAKAAKAAEAEAKAAEAAKAVEAAKAKAAEALKADSSKLVSIFAGETMPTKAEAKNNLNHDLKQVVTGFFAWFNVFCKLFVNLSTALELEKTDKDAAKVLRSKLGDVGQNLFNFISLNRSDIDMNVLHDILLNRNAQPVFSASDYIQKARFDAYLKRVIEGKATKDKDGNVRPFAKFDKNSQWTAPYFTRCLLLACSKKHIKEQRQVELLAKADPKS